MSELAIELVLPLLRQVKEVRLAIVGCMLVVAEDNLDEAIERLEAARDLDVKQLPRGPQRDLAQRIGSYAGSLAHDLKACKEKM